jgi:hypothetical protein
VPEASRGPGEDFRRTIDASSPKAGKNPEIQSSLGGQTSDVAEIGSWPFLVVKVHFSRAYRPRRSKSYHYVKLIPRSPFPSHCDLRRRWRTWNLAESLV